MDKAKQAVSDFMHKSGKHDTTVHEKVAPSVTSETVKPHQHENVTTAVDKEVHQDHYHRTVQPVQDREVLPEQHTHNLGAVQHREFDHRDHESTNRALAAEQGGFKNTQTVEQTSHSQEAAPTVAGEHVHHHIHETIQPVVHKETVQPHVVHTTVPVHETHHNAAQHHETSSLPPVSMSDFKSKGGVLGGREERYDGFEGEPKNIGGVLGKLTGKRDSHHQEVGMEGKHSHGVGHEQHGHHHDNSNLTTGADKMTQGGMRNTDPTTGRSTTGERTGDMSGLGAGAGGNIPSTGQRKPGMMDKLNPMKDSDGDGKKGFME